METDIRHQFVGIEKLKKLQSEELKRFEKSISEKKWSQIHHVLFKSSVFDFQDSLRLVDVSHQ
jgi:hypothetical protein